MPKYTTFVLGLAPGAGRPASRGPRLKRRRRQGCSEQRRNGWPPDQSNQTCTAIVFPLDTIGRVAFTLSVGVCFSHATTD